jgi:hypothetical protein
MGLRPAGRVDGTPIGENMKKLLVASVYAPSERNQTWLDLQLRYLRQTVDSFDLAVYLNRVDPDHFPGTLHINRPAQPRAAAGPATPPPLVKRAIGYLCRRNRILERLIDNKVKTEHSCSLNRVLEYFRRRQGEYENYLILDSDAFPFRAGWLPRLLSWMKGGQSCGEKQYAAVVRTENLDTFPHPCAFFIKGSFLSRFRFDFTGRRYPEQTNLAGAKVSDVGSAIPTVWGGRHVMLPLLRSNVWNPHPILGAIYGGMFYHHGAGSRAIGFRASNMGFLDHALPPGGHLAVDQLLYAELCSNSDRLLERLAVGDTAWLKSA